MGNALCKAKSLIGDVTTQPGASLQNMDKCNALDRNMKNTPTNLFIEVHARDPHDASVVDKVDVFERLAKLLVQVGAQLGGYRGRVGSLVRQARLLPVC